MKIKPKESFELVERFAVPPAKLYAMWLHPVHHGQFTGGAEAFIEPKVDELYSAWDGYIEGTQLVLEPPHRIVQSWRTADFGASDKDSRLELIFEPEGEGTRLTLRHTELPHGTGDTYKAGWEEYYFVHMRKLLGSMG